MGLGAGRPDPIRQSQSFGLSLENFTLRTAPNNLHMEDAATATKKISRRNQIAQSFLLDKPPDRKEHWLAGGDFSGHDQLELGNVEAMKNAVHLSIAQLAVL